MLRREILLRKRFKRLSSTAALCLLSLQAVYLKGCEEDSEAHYIYFNSKHTVISITSITTAILVCLLFTFHSVTMIVLLCAGLICASVTSMKSHLSDRHRLIVKIWAIQGCYGDYSSWQHRDQLCSMIGHPCAQCIGHGYSYRYILRSKYRVPK